MTALEWLVRLSNFSFDTMVVPIACRCACIVPLYKRKGDKCECSNSRGISLSVVGKLFGRVLIKRVRAGTESAMGRSNVSLGMVKDAWNKCLPYGRFVKSI